MTIVALQTSLFAPPPPHLLGPRSDAAPAPYRDPFLAAHGAALDAAGEGRLAFDGATWDHAARGAVGLDVEVFRNLFLLCFKRFADGRRLAFERSARADLDLDLIRETLGGNVTVSFNGLAYDLPLIYLAMRGAAPEEIKAASDAIVLGGENPRRVAERFGIRVPRLDHIDLMEVNPAVHQGLKMLHGRLHGRFLVDLPYAPDSRLTPRAMNVVTLYCMNDLDATEGLYRALRAPLELRVALGWTVGLDLRSHSDAQVGEAIVCRRTARHHGAAPAAHEGAFGYSPPPFVAFEGDALRGVLDLARATTFLVDAAGRVSAPPWLTDLKVTIGGAAYSMGIGGLHSTEAHRAIIPAAGERLLDVDVASQYPTIITRLGLYPPALGPVFLRVYADLIADRLEAKAAGDRTRADGGRIALNGVFGKLGSPYSPLYSPRLLIAVTLTGQLAILMLIERAEAAGFRVVSANTDGAVLLYPAARAGALDVLIAGWEADTGFAVERTPYRALYSSSVNAYVALRGDGKVKRKGYLANPWAEGDLRGQMSKNPQMTVCSDAVVRYLTTGAPFEETIAAARDPRAFVSLIRVTGGAVWRGHPLGRAVRYYWSLHGEPIRYADGRRRVGRTEGARPMQEITAELPPDLDLLRYHQEAVRIAADIGVPGF